MSNQAGPSNEERYGKQYSASIYYNRRTGTLNIVEADDSIHTQLDEFEYEYVEELLGPMFTIVFDRCAPLSLNTIFLILNHRHNIDTLLIQNCDLTTDESGTTSRSDINLDKLRTFVVSSMKMVEPARALLIQEILIRAANIKGLQLNFVDNPEIVSDQFVKIRQIIAERQHLKNLNIQDVKFFSHPIEMPQFTLRIMELSFFPVANSDVKTAITEKQCDNLTSFLRFMHRQNEAPEICLHASTGLVGEALEIMLSTVLLLPIKKTKLFIHSYEVNAAKLFNRLELVNPEVKKLHYSFASSHPEHTRSVVDAVVNMFPNLTEFCDIVVTPPPPPYNIDSVTGIFLPLARLEQLEKITVSGYRIAPHFVGVVIPNLKSVDIVNGGGDVLKDITNFICDHPRVELINVEFNGTWPTVIHQHGMMDFLVLILTRTSISSIGLTFTQEDETVDDLDMRAEMISMINMHATNEFKISVRCGNKDIMDYVKD